MTERRSSTKQHEHKMYFDKILLREISKDLTFFNSIITKSYRKDNVLSIIFCITNYKSFLLLIRIPPALTKKQEVEVLECCIHPVRISFGTRTERNIRISLQSHQTRREENSARMGESTQTGIHYVQLLTSLS